MAVQRIFVIVLFLFLLAGLTGSANASIPSPSLPDAVGPTGLPDPLVQYMLNQVTTEQVMNYDRALSGEMPVWVDDDWYTITTRYTYSGEPVQKAAHYVGQHMQALDLEVEYHIWDDETNPNVIGELAGLYDPQDIFIIGGHLDDVPDVPGADDNASGSVAALIAADILSQYNWGCTLRFAFWTGEEQWLLGSNVYAERASQNGENILGYLNLDMIGYNTIDSPPGIDLAYNGSMPPTQEMAQLFADVIGAYELNLIPQLIDDPWGGSDHLSFWEFGFTSILAIEDNADFNPYYHETGDTPDHLDPVYFTDFVKASLGTFVHMSGCLIPRGLSEISGEVTSADTAGPIEGAALLFEGSLGKPFSTLTDPQGFYSQTLVVDTYTVTASAYGYLPEVVSGVELITDTARILDFSLQTAPTYILSGTVSEIESGTPLLAQVLVDETPASTWTDPATGFYQIELPQGDYTLTVKSDYYLYQKRAVSIGQDQTQDFQLERQGCILLVDDDQDNPDVRDGYSEALELLDASYDVWDIAWLNSPAEQDLSGYPAVVWFTGSARSTTLYTRDETVLVSYLDNGGNLFFSSQDYLHDRDLTSFGKLYLGVSDFVNDVGQLDVVGQNVFDGLGPYHLFFPFTDYSDMLIPADNAQIAFAGNTTDAAVSFSGDGFNTIFLAFPFEAAGQAEDRAAVLSRTLEFFGGCDHPQAVVAPLSIDMYVTAGQSTTAELLIQNSGSGTLTFAISDTQEMIWISIFPSNGSLLPSSSQSVSVGINASLLESGSYSTTLQISSNSTEQATIEVLVSLTVVDPIYITNLPVLSKQ
jgi:hypothetical protein